MSGNKETLFKITDTGERFEIRKPRCKASVIVPYQKGDVFEIVETVCAALNNMEAGRTVRAKRPVQQRKGTIPLCVDRKTCGAFVKGPCGNK